MSKTFIQQSAILIALISVFVACTNEDDFSGTSQSIEPEIQLNAMMDGDAGITRSAELTRSALNTFSVNAYDGTNLYLSGTYSTSEADSLNFTESDNKVYYWPENKVLTFRAVTNYQYDKTDKKYVNKPTIPGLTISSSAISGTYSVEDTLQSDPCISVVHEEMTTSGNVDLKFYHILSRIGINVCHKPGNEQLLVRVTGYTINGIKYKGDFKYTDSIIDGKGSNKNMNHNVWSNQQIAPNGLTTKVEMAEGTYLDSVLVTNKVLDGSEFTNIIPSGSILSSIILDVEFYNSVSKTFIAKRKMTANKTAFTGGVSSYEPGFGYIYNFTIVGNGGSTGIDGLQLKFEKTETIVDPWSNVSGGSATFSN